MSEALDDCCAPGVAEPGAGRAPPRAAFLAASGVVFVAGVLGTAALMPRGAAMPGMGMASPWAPVPGGSWPAAAAAFLAMWVVSMVAMMMPALVPTLATYRRAAAGAGGPRLGAATAVAAAGYFAVWAAAGAAAFVAGAAWHAAAARWTALGRGSAVVAAAALVAAGCLQLTPWKARRLARCRAPERAGVPAAGLVGAWRYGLEAGTACATCCAGLMTVMLVAGVMDWRVMAAVAAAITVERVAPWPAAAARLSGALAVALGVLALVRG